MKRILVVLVILLIAGYGIFEARRLIEGPHVVITSPLGGTATSSPTVLLTGKAENISFLTINDTPAFTDEHGIFSVLLSPPPGYAIFTVSATDRFGRKASAQVRISVLNFCPVRQE